MLLQRRAFLTGFGSLLAAPMIVHAENIMPVSSKCLLLPTYDFDSFDDPGIGNGVRYQWMDRAMAKTATVGWIPVPAYRYNERFCIPGDTIERGGLTLMQQPRVAVEEARGKEIQAAHSLADSWAMRHREFIRW